MDDLAAMLHPWTCEPEASHDDGGWWCEKAAAAIAPRLTPTEVCGWDTRRGDGPIGGPCALPALHDGPHDPNPPVHNHGPEDGPGVACRERLIGGRLIGACVAAPRLTPDRDDVANRLSVAYGAGMERGAALARLTPDREALEHLSVALQRAGVLSPSHMTYHDTARCVLAALTDGRDDLGAPDEHQRHALAASQPVPTEPKRCGCGHPRDALIHQPEQTVSGHRFGAVPTEPEEAEVLGDDANPCLFDPSHQHHSHDTEPEEADGSEAGRENRAPWQGGPQ